MAKVDDDTLETHFALGPLVSAARRDRARHPRAREPAGAPQSQRSAAPPSVVLAGRRLSRTRGCSTAPSSCSASCATARRSPSRRSTSSSTSTSASRNGRKPSTRTASSRCCAATKSSQVAHYYCELAELARAAGDRALAREHLRNTVRSESGALRGTLIRATLAREEQDYAQAIPLYEQVIAADRHFITEVLPLLLECYRACESLGRVR